MSTPAERASTQRALLLLGMIVLVRAIMSFVLPLSFDEAYYWRWSQHLAAGYLDHPPLIAFIIRAGTMLFGDSQFAVRFVPLLLSILASWAVWRAAAILLKSEYAGAIAALFYNLTLMVGVEALVATPDAPSMAASAFLLYSLVKLVETDRAPWWLGVGVAGGVALLSKYTGFFLGAGVLAWLVLVKDQRHWLRSIWPYLSGAIALLIFAPVILWNAQHEWISFERQFGRVTEGGLTLRFLGEFLGAQIGLATPFIFALGVIGICGIALSKVRRSSDVSLLPVLMIPAILYFLMHSLHARVQGNWPSFLYPMLVICAVIAMRWSMPGWRGRALRFCQHAALPVAFFLTLLVYVQATRSLIPLEGTRDPIARLLAVGYAPLARDIDRLRLENGAQTILTTGYAQTGWLSFYLPSHPMVVQINERERWLAEPAPDPEVFEEPLLYVTEDWRDMSSLLNARFADVELIERLERSRNGVRIEGYAIYRARNPIAPVLD